jgi:Fe-S cluster assembly iron-binding protein IscA
VSLALTDHAVEAVREILSSADQVETGGVRMAAEGDGLRLSIVPLPAEDDEVIGEQGARVFLEPQAAHLLDDKVLDATIDGGQVTFSVADQAAG